MVYVLNLDPTSEAPLTITNPEHTFCSLTISLLYQMEAESWLHWEEEKEDFIRPLGKFIAYIPYETVVSQR